MIGEGRMQPDGNIFISRETVSNMHRRDRARFAPFIGKYNHLTCTYAVKSDTCPGRLRRMACYAGRRDEDKEKLWGLRIRTFQKISYLVKKYGVDAVMRMFKSC